MLVFFTIIETPHSCRLTPEISPKINMSGTELVMTPLILGLEGQDCIDQIELEGFQLEPEVKQKHSKKSGKHLKKHQQNRQANRLRLNSTWHFFENQLQQIIEEQNWLNNEEDLYEYSQCSSDQSEILEEAESQIESDKLDDKHSHTNILSQQVCEPLFLEWQVPNPKAQLISKLKRIDKQNNLESAEAKLECYRQIISSYIVEFEKYYFEDSMNKLFSSVFQSEAEKMKIIQNTLFEGINQTFNRKIGGITFEKRRLKLLKYMDKKKKRSWLKKVNYDCRKKVADCRLRIKGKFVTIGQACGQLGISQKQGSTTDDIRVLLERTTTTTTAAAAKNP